MFRLFEDGVQGVWKFLENAYSENMRYEFQDAFY